MFSTEFTQKYEISERYFNQNGSQYVERALSVDGDIIASEHMRSTSQRGELNRVVHELRYISGMSTEQAEGSRYVGSYPRDVVYQLKVALKTRLRLQLLEFERKFLNILPEKFFLRRKAAVVKEIVSIKFQC